MSNPITNGSRKPTPTRPFSLRLTPRDIAQLQARAFAVSGTATGIARNLIVTGLSGGDGAAVADRLMQIERRQVALEGNARDIATTADRIEAVVAELRTKFEALLNALSSSEGAS